MNGGRPVVWAVVRDLGRTGVPLALARLATWPGTATAVDLRVVARFDGPVRADLERAGIPVVALEPAGSRSPAATVAAATRSLGLPRPGTAVEVAVWRRRVRHLPRPDVVLAQGAGAWPVVERLGVPASARTVVHLHELDVGLRRSLAGASLDAALAADQILAVSEPVAALARRLGAAAERIAIVPGTVGPVAPVACGSTDLVTIGEAGWRKGTDRAIAAAHELRRLAPQLRWHWIGRGPEPGWGYAAGVDLPVTFHPPSADPWAVVPAPAVLVVPSREDPLPLVALEAGARGIPVVACAGAGGLDQLLADGRGRLADAADPRDLARHALEAAGAGTGSGEALRALVARDHRDEVVAHRWLAALVGPS